MASNARPMAAEGPAFLDSLTVSKTRAALLKLSTCDLCDAMERIRASGFIPNTSVVSPVSGADFCVAGPAYTVELACSTDKVPPASKPASSSYLDNVPESYFVVIKSPSTCQSSCWGGLLTTRAKYKRLAGTLVDGKCRDVPEHQEANYPVITTRGRSCLRAAAVTPLWLKSCLNPITIGDDLSGFPGVEIRLNDWIVSDANGTVCIPGDKVGDVIARARAIAKVDLECKALLQRGETLKVVNRQRKVALSKI